MLVTLRGCHLLDGLVACGSIEASKKIVRGSGEGIVRGIVLGPWGSRRATLVERDAKGDKWSGGSSARARGERSTWDGMTSESLLARGLAATLELVSMGTSLVATK
jgi:hypothetical protein